MKNLMMKLLVVGAIVLNSGVVLAGPIAANNTQASCKGNPCCSKSTEPSQKVELKKEVPVVRERSSSRF